MKSVPRAKLGKLGLLSLLLLETCYLIPLSLDFLICKVGRMTPILQRVTKIRECAHLIFGPKEMCNWELSLLSQACSDWT